MGLDLNTALISDTFDGLIKTQDGNVLTASPLPIGDGRGNDSSLALATAGNGVTITGTLTVDGTDISGGLATAQADIIAIEAKTDYITVTGAINLDTVKTKTDFITVTQAVDLDTIESDIAVATAKTDFITVTQDVDLDTMESDILSAKTKTDFISITQAVNLDTVESGLATAQSDITAIEAKTDYITISSALNLNTVASNASAAKTKTDYLTVTQAVDLDTLESDVNVAKGDITAIEAKTDYITISSALNLNTMASNASSAKTKTDFITITQAVNLDTVESGLSQAQTDINQIEGKTDYITVTQAVNLDTMESDIATNNAKNSYPAGDATKVGFISVTQAVDLDSMETDISNLSSNKYDKTGGTISGNVTVTGDLTVNGTTTTVNTETLSVKDPLIELANQNSANSVDTGFYANYSLDAGVTTKYAGLFKDAGDSDKFKLFKGLEVEPTTTVDTTGTGYTKGDLVVGDLDAVTISGDFTGNVTATSVLADGVTATTQSAGDNSTKVATTAYVDAVVTAQDLDFAGDSGTGAVDLDSQSLTIAGTTNEIETSASGQTITIGLPSSVTVGTLNATTLGGTLSTAAQTNITSVGTLSSLAVSGDLTVDTSTLKVDAANNRVGIGTSSPTHLLQLYSASLPELRLGDAITQIQMFTNTDAFFGTVGSHNLIFRTAATERMRINSSGSIKISDGTLTGGGGFEITSEPFFGASFQSGAYKFNNANNTSEYMRIDSSGNVGIGTSSPNSNTNRSTLTLQGAWGGQVDINVGGTNHAQFGTDNFTSGLGCRIQSKDGIVFYGTGSTERMRIDSSGLVGIGGLPQPATATAIWGDGASSSSYSLICYNSGGFGALVVRDDLNVSIGGDLSFSNGRGIDFSASAGGGATSSLLDDYEEGTWTPAITFGDLNVGITYTVNTGRYVKIGRTVTVNGYINLSSKGSSTGPVKVTGLPFTNATPSPVQQAYTAGSLHINAVSYSGYPNMYLLENDTRLFLAETSTAGVLSELTNADFANNSGLIVTITYQV